MNQSPSLENQSPDAVPLSEEDLARQRAEEALRLLAEELEGLPLDPASQSAEWAATASAPEGERVGEWALDDLSEWKEIGSVQAVGRREPVAPARQIPAEPEGPRGKEFMQTLRVNAMAPGQAMTAWYQPQFTGEGLLCGVEALLRWPRPEGGFYATAQVIPLAESAGVLGTLDTWMMGRVAEQTVAWKKNGFLKNNGARVALNISQAELLRGAIESESVRLASQGQLDPSLIELEISESAVMERFDECARALERLSLMGFAIALDDFGTGYISLSKLARLSVNKIKVNRAVTRELPRREEQSVVRMSMALGRELNAQVVVEGVETQEQAQWLLGQGAQALQGYWLAKPVSAAGLEELMANNPIPARLQALSLGVAPSEEGDAPAGQSEA